VTRREIVRRMVLNEIWDDFEHVGEMIFAHVPG
jgi:hypothetical protein